MLLLGTFLLTVLLVPMTPTFWGLLAVQASCLVYQAWWIVPYTRLFPVEVKPARPDDPGRRLRIVTANVLTTNRNAAGLIGLVETHRPDILVTLESDAWWQNQLAPLERDYPHTIRHPLDNRYGMHVYSALPLSECETTFLVEPGVPSMHALVTLRSGQSVRVHFLHPAPPSPTENAESSERDAELIVVARSVAQADGPVVVTGDLNDVAWSATTRLFRKISGLLDPRVGRGMFNTFHARHWYLRWPLDHLFHSAHFTLRHVERLPAFGSDHFPLLSELALEPVRGAPQGALEADADDRAWAREIASAEAVTPDDVPSPGEATRRAVSPLDRRGRAGLQLVERTDDLGPAARIRRVAQLPIATSPLRRSSAKTSHRDSVPPLPAPPATTPPARGRHSSAARAT
ncbi:MAG: endonuclease/exonuclease/phosphatase family protein [Gemmatimonadales bacterium]